MSFGSLDHRPTSGLRITMLLLYGGIAVGLGAIAYGLSSLRSWVRIPAIVLSVIGLLGFPIGTVINAYVLYLLLSKKGGTILAAGYADVIRATPHIRFKRRIGDWIALAILILFILAVVVYVGTRD